MLRIILINLFFLMLPSLIYFAYVYFIKKQDPDADVSGAPVFWLFAVGLLLMLASVAYFIETEGGKPGEVYVPPRIEDGKIVPGRTQPR